jgi:3-phosphoshikimate 1-carboxyvinyltransferase
MRLRARAGSPLKGRARAPGDKSISHRALILSALAKGVSEVTGLLDADDVMRTADAARSFGARVERAGDGLWRIEGAGGFDAPAGTIECGNSGTAARLLIGAAAGYPIATRFDGDSSLRRRPMRRIAEPLIAMGARIEGELLPLTVHGGGLKGVTHRSPVASAQIKSAVLLAGLNADGDTIVIEPARSRDHTERMLAAFGADVGTVEIDGASHPRVRRSRLTGTRVHAPADPSSAAFAIAAATIVAGSEVRLEGVLVNPLRAGFYATLAEMGADLVVENERESGGECVADLVARSSALKGGAPPASRAPSMIDEYPILAALAAFAEGETRLTGADELRVKESDRIALMAQGLRACGVAVEELPDGLVVQGAGTGGVTGGAAIETQGDHRIAMAFLVLGLGAHNPVIVDQADMIETSFPNFAGFMAALGADIAPA